MKRNNVDIKPHITEKTYQMANDLNKYVFKVKGEMNKIELKKYIENKYKVKVEKVNSLVKPGKKHIYWRRRKMYRKSDERKYAVHLKKGDKIDEFLNQ